MTSSKQLSNQQMININFGYLGIQLAWALQFANISGVFQFLGAADNQIPILWLAGPITGLIIPPVIGFISDYTWVKYLGRRRFYILIGVTLSAIALLSIANTRNLTNAVLLVWLLDSGLNIAMHPYRALVADVTPINQHTKCFSFLSMASGIGSAVAFITPWILAFVYQPGLSINKHSIPVTIEIALVGGAVILLLTNIWSILAAKEYKKDIKKINIHNDSSSNCNSYTFSNIKKKLLNLLYMPPVMKDLIKVEFFNWIGVFTFIIYYSLGISQNIYNLPVGVKIENNLEYSILLQKGVELGGLHSFFYIIISTLFAASLSRLCNYFERKNIYATCLALGGVGLICASYSNSADYLLLTVLLFGLAWGAAVTIPFAILSSGVPKDKVGWYMGYYNFFVVIPQVIVSISFGYLIRVVFQHHAMSLIALGGFFMIIASMFAYKVRDPYNNLIHSKIKVA